MKQQDFQSFMSYLEPDANWAQLQCSKKGKKKNCCDKISRKGKYCKGCPQLKK